MNADELIAGVLRISQRLESCSIPYAFGGAIAYGFYGNPRVTNDYDINIFLAESKATEVFACLRPLGIESDEESLREVERKGQVRLRWRSVMVDLFFAYAPFHDAASLRVRGVPFAGTKLSVLSPEDLMVFKVLFNRPHDWEDIERLVAEQGASLVVEYAYQWLTEILGGDDSRIERLRRVVTRSGELMAETD